LELLVFREPDTEFYTCNVISLSQSLGSLHVTRVQTIFAKGSPLFHPTNTNAMGYLSDACTRTELNHVDCVVVQIANAS